MSAPETDAEVRGPIASYALKHDASFLVADALGDVRGGADGLFRNDTRVLSRFRLTIGGVLPALLGSGVSSDNVFFRANVTNRPLPQLGDHAATPEGVIHVERARLLWNERLYERLTLTNYGERAVPARLTFELGADFADIFEVRGHVRPRRGRMLPPDVARQHVRFRYQGLDEVERASAIAFSRVPDVVDATHAEFNLLLQRRAHQVLYLEIGPDVAAPGQSRYREAGARARVAMRCKRRRGSTLRTSGRLFNLWIDKSRADLALLETEMPTGPYPFAGIPWFSTPFGRDAIVTALQTLWLDPQLARGVLSFLARHQARETSRFADSAPGKIMHETRKGEMAALREVPFARYYGGVDTTPLFVMLAGAYAARTADLAFVEELWPSLCAAMAWIEGPGDSNGDGFLDYARGADSGLANQGWKDSVDSIFHADGRLAQGPIALVEVQGYVYAARLAMADLAARRGDRALAQRWHDSADALRAAVEERFWMEDARFYAIAIDGEGELCRVRASNAGHLLYTGLPSAERARHVTEQLLANTFDSGWGVRTLCDGAARFNPMSYHDGSVWPHDSGICAAGMARYGDRAGIRHLIDEIFGAAHHFGMRLPELFCGFARAAGEPPVGYPVACLPQAWSSGAIFMMLQAALGLTIDAWESEVRIERPELPGEIERLLVHDLVVAGQPLDLCFQRVGDRVTASPARTIPDSLRVTVRI